MCQLDVAMMDCVHRLATNAVAASHLELKPSNSMERRAAKWLEEWAELARDGKLLPAAIAATTVLSQPCLVTSPETAYSKRQLLLSQRWQLAPHARKACAQSKLLHPRQAESYYELLLEHAEGIAQAGQAFSHTQSSYYYAAVQAAIANALTLNAPAISWEDTVGQVPRNMKADFYDILAQFFSGVSDIDPRCDLTQQQPQKRMVRRKTRPAKRRLGRQAGESDVLRISSESDGEEVLVVDMDVSPRPSSSRGNCLSFSPAVRKDLQRCLAAESCHDVQLEDAQDEAVDDEPEPAEMRNRDDPADAAPAHPDPDAVRAAVEALKPLAEQHHRSKDTARIIIDVALPELCRSILQHPDELPATRVEHAMQSIDRRGERFWGAHQTFSRKRTVRDVLLLVYHDRSQELLS
ncbi:unnamed protein product [Effrenium voratum]|nr:unnamed protein product [Effrenium voratum]